MIPREGSPFLVCPGSTVVSVIVRHYVNEIQGLGFQIMVNPGLAGFPGVPGLPGLSGLSGLPGLPGLAGLPYSGTPEHLSSFLLKLTTTFMLIFLNLLNYVLLFLDLIKLDY